jgi:hypothetical protein
METFCRVVPKSERDCLICKYEDTKFSSNQDDVSVTQILNATVLAHVLFILETLLTSIIALCFGLLWKRNGG